MTNKVVWDRADQELARFVTPKRRWKIETIRIHHATCFTYRCRVIDLYGRADNFHIERDSLPKLAAALHVRDYTNASKEVMEQIRSTR